ncbi:hypothetical protein LSM04_003596 [Trypanosoma melophagium]|uniref:uncharacterized protein n=1 Tax=Trypanosoma melophagium TaxID=715481 RepID=UPI00351A42D9|nr:hypothetical protein LSM04_003596 [Trypanosoma melophagium]
MQPPDDTAIDALIHAEDERLRRFQLFHQTKEERRRVYGAIPSNPPPPAPPPANRPTLTGNEEGRLTPDTEETLVCEYRDRSGTNRNSNSNNNKAGAIGMRHRTPPPNYTGPMLTLTTDGPYTRYEVLAARPPPRPHYDENKPKLKPRSSHYPRPVEFVLQEDDEMKKKPQPGESLRRWKYNMGLTDD